MTLVPADNPELTVRYSRQASSRERRAALEIHSRSLQTAVATEIDRMDSQAIADVITTATEEEVRFLKYGLALADGSAAATELIVRKANLMSNLNNRRIARRFGR
jgi:riboflavin biosynthesis pyrimidine reductase